MISKIKNKINSFIKQQDILTESNYKIVSELHDTKILFSKLLINDIQKRGLVTNLQETEFKVFSQFGDDGIIQYLIHNVEIKNKTFIEFGVENYTESNTRFLLLNNNWKGLVMDGNMKNIEQIRSDGLYWRHDLKAVCNFIKRENINQLFVENGFEGEVGILSIDLDGNDYWIWEAIDVVSPTIVIIEYNSVLGAEFPISIPYDENFIRSKAHYSYLYWGASLAALNHLAIKKGYKFVGSNSAGNNAYFVKQNKVGNLKTLTSEEGYVESHTRESRDKDGNLNFLSGKNRLKEIENCMVIDVTTNKKIIIKDL